MIDLPDQNEYVKQILPKGESLWQTTISHKQMLHIIICFISTTALPPKESHCFSTGGAKHSKIKTSQ